MYKSKQIEKYKTYSIPQWTEGKTTYRGKVTYGMHYILGNSQPYFSITAFTERKGRNGHSEEKWFEDSGGCLHDLIKERAKYLAPLISFHLVDQDGLPMYYLENRYYWYKKDLATFRNYILLSDDEKIPEVPKVELPVILNDNGTELDLPEKEQKKITESVRKQVIIQWLRTREAKLKQDFDEAMTVFGVQYITKEEIEALK